MIVLVLNYGVVISKFPILKFTIDGDSWYLNIH